jgi:hypothetical protein
MCKEQLSFMLQGGELFQSGDNVMLQVKETVVFMREDAISVTHCCVPVSETGVFL